MNKTKQQPKTHTCPNCGSEQPGPEFVYEHSDCGHTVCSDCGERHLEDCEWLSKQGTEIQDVD